MPDEQLRPGDDEAAERAGSGLDPSITNAEEQQGRRWIPDHMAFIEAISRIDGDKIPDEGFNGTPTDPAYRALVEHHIADQLYKRWMAQMAPMQQYRTQDGAPIYNNSVTPSGETLS